MNYDHIGPISSEEVEHALNEMKRSASGLDRLSASALLRYGSTYWAALFNIFLSQAHLPSHLNVARIIFVPKCDNPTEPSHFRPISVTSVITRSLHKILASRWSRTFPLDGLQFGFLHRDGCYEATTLLHAVLRHSHSACEPMAFAAIDISKAFDGVSHDTLLRSAQAFGAPSLLLAYLRNCYSNSLLRLNGELRHSERGVRQGDPLSPLLFIMALDEVLDSLPGRGVQVEGLYIQSWAYADDLLLFAQTKSDLPLSLEHLRSELELAGLHINFKKSKAAVIVASKKPRFVALEQTPVSIQGTFISPLKPSKVFNYLGVPFTCQGNATQDCLGKRDQMLGKVTSAPLKPHQRIDILTRFLIPRLTYSLILGIVHRKTLRSIDRKIRAAVRRWLRLPADTPVAFFHADIKDGGIGIPNAAISTILNRRHRLEQFLSSSIPQLYWAVRSPASVPSLRLAHEATMIGEGAAESPAEAKSCWRKELLKSHDGAGLRDASRCPQSSLWLQYPTEILPKIYIRGMQLRARVLNTKVRRSRGNRGPRDVNCRGGCDHHESLPHILQRFAITHDARCSRHNEVCRLLAKKLVAKGQPTFMEPRVPTDSTFCEPDLILVPEISPM